MRDRRNIGADFDTCLHLWNTSDNGAVNLPAVELVANTFSYKSEKDKNGQIASLLRAVTCIDLTTLCGDDTSCNVSRLCNKAATPIDIDILSKLGINPKKIHVGAVCVYPARVADCVKTLHNIGAEIPVAAVAAGFPSGQYNLDTKLEEIKDCIKDGAQEIDIVISRNLVLQGEWEKLFEEVKSFREACGEHASLKTIIAAGELGSLDNVYKASVVCMAAGADFIKTSTGKDSVNATLPIGITMTRAVKDYYMHTGIQVGFKPAGGIRTAKDVFQWQTLMRKELGSQWLFPDLFRIGASGLLGDIEHTLFQKCIAFGPSTAEALVSHSLQVWNIKTPYCR